MIFILGIITDYQDNNNIIIPQGNPLNPCFGRTGSMASIIITIIIILQGDPLNPCFGRTGSMASIIITIIIIPQRATLNPCFDGIWSLTIQNRFFVENGRKS